MKPEVKWMNLSVSYKNQNPLGSSKTKDIRKERRKGKGGKE